MTDVEVFLKHHGIKGQKWGTRNSKRSGMTRKKKMAIGAGFAALYMTTAFATVKANNLSMPEPGRIRIKNFIDVTSRVKDIPIAALNP